MKHRNLNEDDIAYIQEMFFYQTDGVAQRFYYY